jgi:branched-chain amino acid transport system ATP-binding protein
MLEISDLNTFRASAHILHGVTLSVSEDEVVCLVGRNGAGKTTTFRSIMGYRRALSGGISFDGADLTKLPTWQIAQAGIGFAPEESEVYADLTVAENIELSTWTRPSGRPAKARIEEAYTVFPKLRQYLARGGAQLSGGERKMVSIARALTLDPKLLLLDEPFEGLSPAIIPQLAESIAAIARLGPAILVAESNIHHVPASTTRLYVIERGEIVFAGRPAELRGRDDLARIVGAGL